MADHAAAGTLSHHDRQPNGVALGMDHLDKAHQLGPVAAGPDRYQLTRAKVHGLRVVQMLCLPIVWWAAEASLKNRRCWSWGDWLARGGIMGSAFTD